MQMTFSKIQHWHRTDKLAGLPQPSFQQLKLAQLSRKLFISAYLFSAMLNIKRYLRMFGNFYFKIKYEFLVEL